MRNVSLCDPTEMNAKTELAHGWVDQPNGRGTIDIIWSCVITIFLCSWSVLFLNIPRKSGLRSFLTTKLSWVAFTIFFPEILAAFAQQQWVSASQSVLDFSRLGYTQWSLRHAFFADMGGFVLDAPDYLPFPVDAHQIHYLVANNFIAFPTIDKEAIWDKNKADGFARVLTSVQVVWFALQCLGRAIQHISMSTFELSTLAFVLCTFPTFFWWRHKPLDVATAIPILLKDQVRITDILLSAGNSANKPFKFTPLDFVNPPSLPFNFLCPIMWALQLLFDLGADPKHGPITSFRNSARMAPREMRVVDFVVIGIITLTYISVHLIGWNFVFPTTVERNLWRSATLILSGSAVSYMLLFLLLTWQLPAFRRLFGVSRANTAVEVFDLLPWWLQYLVAASWVGSYGTARLYLIVEAFISLRALPLAAYETVNWSNFLPHL
jgi:hypothetical protein